MSIISFVFFFISALLSSLVWAQTIEPYFQLSGERLPPAERIRIYDALKQKKYDPNQWPEVTFVKKEQTLIPMMGKQTYWQISLPVFNHTTQSMEVFSGFKFFPATNYNPKTSRLVVINPTIEGESLVERNLVRMALAEGHHAMIASVFDFPYQTGEFALDDIRERTIFGVKAIKTFFDLLEHTYNNEQVSQKSALSILKNVFPSQILQIGVSNGTVATLMVSQTDLRVSHQALIVPIGNIPGVFAKTTNEKLTALRNEQMAFHNISDPQEFANLVRKRLKVDPLDVFGLFADEPVPKTLAFTQSVDSTVPPEFQKEVVNRIRAMSVTLAIDRFGIDKEFVDVLYASANRIAAEKGLSSPVPNPFDGKMIEQIQKQRILEAIQSQQHTDSLFHEVGIGHVKKILAVTFVFNKELRTFMNDGFNPDRMELSFYAARGIKLNPTRSTSKDVKCKKAVGSP